jgi:hypothetical protein
MPSFYTYNIIGNENSAREHLRRLEPTSVFYMDAAGGANWAAQTLPNCKVIHRVYTPQEDVMHRTPGATLAYLQARASEHLDGRIYINLSCEPQLARSDDLQRLIDEQLKAFQWAKQAGVRVAGPHFAHYGLDERHWATVEPLTTFIAQNPDQFLFTADEYFAGHAFSGVVHPGLLGGNEVGHIQPETWKASPVPYYYHVGRITNLFRWLQEHGKPLPPTVITEAGADALGDVTDWRNSLIKSPGYDNIRGWRSLTSQWEAWYGNRGWSPQRAYLEMLVAAWREIYKPWPNVIGAQLYCWGTNNDRQWDQFRLDEADAAEFRQRLEQTTFDIGVPPVTNPIVPVPKPNNAGEGSRVTNTSVDSYRVRSGPGTNYTQVGGVASKAEVTIYPATKRAGGNFQWVWVEGGTGQAGWIADDGQFKAVTPSVPNWWPVDRLRHLDVTFASQRNTGTANNCLEAAAWMVFNYVGRMTDNADIYGLTVGDVIRFLNNNGQFSTLADGVRLGKHFGVKLNVKTNQTLQNLLDELDAGRPVIALVERGKLPAIVQTFYAFTGAHFVTVVGYDAKGFTIHDPLSLPDGKGDSLLVSPADFEAAWRSTTGNSGLFQALYVDPSALTVDPVEPDDCDEEIARLDSRVAILEMDNARLTSERDEAINALDAVRETVSMLYRILVGDV